MRSPHTQPLLRRPQSEDQEEQGEAPIGRPQRISGGTSHSQNPESAEPAWRQAFRMGDGVIATRTPDRVIHARNRGLKPTHSARNMAPAPPVAYDGARLSHRT